MKDRTLETKDIHKLEKAYDLSEQLITRLIQTKTKRETAQYDATPSITRETAKTKTEGLKYYLLFCSYYGYANI